MSALRAELTMDLGTYHTVVYDRSRGEMVSEPTVVAVDRITDKFLAVGEEARHMLGKTPGNVQAVEPIVYGQLADYKISQRMIKYFVQKAVKSSWVRPNMVVGVPAGLTQVSEAALLEICNAAGVHKAYLLEAPLAVALGEGLDIEKPLGRLVVDLGAGLSEAGVISLGGVVSSNSTKTAGKRFDEVISRGIRLKHYLAIGDSTAEQIKRVIGSLIPVSDDPGLEISGRDLTTGLPKTVVLSSDEIRYMLEDPFLEIVDLIEQVLENTPPELVTDIGDQGMLLTGGMSQLKGVKERLQAHFNIPVNRATNRVEGIALGLAKAMDDKPLLEKKLFELTNKNPNPL